MPNNLGVWWGGWVVPCLLPVAQKGHRMEDREEEQTILPRMLFSALEKFGTVTRLAEED